MGVAVSALAVVVVVAIEVRASADTLEATHGGDLVELSHRVSVRLDDREVVYTVTRILHNRGERADEATLQIDLPTGAVATGLSLRIGDRWYDGGLRDATAASELYARLTTSGKLATRGPALLSWNYGSGLSLSVFPIMAESSVTLRYTLRAPVCYVDGHYIADYPISTAADSDLPTPLVRAKDAGRDAARLIDGDAIERTLGINDLEQECRDIGATAGLGFAGRTHIVYPAPIKSGVGVHFARFDVGEGAHIARLEIDAAPELEPRPKDARVVFVVDASHSQTAVDVAAQLELVRAYMSQLPDAAFEIVVYRRHAVRAFGEFVAASRAAEAIAELDASTFFGGNGSNLDRGLSEAVAALGATKRPARIIAFTDSLLRDSLTPEALTAALIGAPDGTILHILDTTFGGEDYAFVRDDSHDLAPVAESTGGMLVTMTGGAGGAPAAEHGVRGLVVPMQIDYFAMAIDDGSTEPVFAVPDTLHHGDGYRLMLLSDRVSDSVRLDGKIWGRDWTATAPAPRDGSGLAALVFGNDLWSSLTEAQTSLAGHAGAVVSPATSFLAMDPKAPPTSYEYDSGLCGIRGFSTSSHCGGSSCSIGIGHLGTMGHSGFGTSWDPVRAIADLLWPHVNGCALANDISMFSMRVVIDATGIEVVDVDVTDATNETMASCVTQAAWDLALDGRFVGDTTYTVSMAWPIE